MWQEGYAVVEVKLEDVEGDSAQVMLVDGLWRVSEVIEKSVAALKACEACDDKERFGVIGE